MKNNPSKNKPTILMVEDENLIALQIRSTLESFGYKVISNVASGEEALKEAGDYEPDLVLMDIQLKGDMNGLAAATFIRQSFNIPVIFLTAYSDDLTLKAAQKAEPFGYILKPINERELFATIEMALSKHAMEKSIQEKERWLTTTLSSIYDPVLCTDENGKITFLNNQACDLFATNREVAIGKQVHHLLHIEGFEQYLEAANPIDRLLMGKEHNPDSRLHLIRKDGGRIPILMSVSLIKGNSKKNLGAVCIIKDVSIQTRNEANLQMLTTRELIAHSAQLLRNLEIIGSEIPGCLSEDQKVLQEMLKQDSLAIYHLSQRLKYCIELELDDIELVSQPCAIKSLVERVLDDIKNEYQEKEIDIELQADENLTPVNANPELLFYGIYWLLAGGLSNMTEGQSIRIDISSTGGVNIRIHFPAMDIEPAKVRAFNKGNLFIDLVKHHASWSFQASLTFLQYVVRYHNGAASLLSDDRETTIEISLI